MSEEGAPIHSNQENRAEKSRSAREQIADQVANSQDFEGLFDVLKNTMRPEQFNETCKIIEDARNGLCSVQIVPEILGLQKKVHQLISSEGPNPELHDAPYVEDQRPWLICAEWLRSGSAGYTPFVTELGLSSLGEFTALENKAQDMLKPSDEEGIFVVTDKNGINWEVSYGRRRGSGHRPGIDRIRFADDRSAKIMYAKIIEKYRSQRSG